VPSVGATNRLETSVFCYWFAEIHRHTSVARLSTATYKCEHHTAPHRTAQHGMQRHG
jgi:hypothetical protein